MSPNFLNVSLEYSKDNDLKRNDVVALMEWVDKQPHLPNITELQAILFLQSCDFSNEIAKITIDNYFTVKTLCPELYGNRNPLVSPLKEEMDVVLYTALPKKTPEEYTIIFIKLMDADPNKFTTSTQLRCLDMILMLHLYQQGTSKGHLIVVDINGLSFGHFARIGPLVLKKFLYYLQEAVPLKLKGLHFLNTLYIDKFMRLAKPFMNEELANMLYIHNTLEDLVEAIPQDCLPKEYGGTVDSVAVLHEKMKTDLCKNIALFEWEEQQKVDETQRPGKPKNTNDLFGVEGTFKQLEID